VPFVELDLIYHQPGWQPLPAEEFRRRVADTVNMSRSGERWISGHHTFNSFRRAANRDGVSMGA
jgi:hypothetical protein